MCIDHTGVNICAYHVVDVKRWFYLGGSISMVLSWWFYLGGFSLFLYLTALTTNSLSSLTMYLFTLCKVIHLETFIISLKC